ncbi:beta-1,3-galactosyltransferase 5-like isoform X2 [Penaeus monodon]|uniref:beta-1,3-galactosyltransferase 5-like isoform X1 n=2 Tax=Penaeus monodon TaxID=6687 RepID=UPI0018A7C417|nr:beta-1,3-galactosyltransferase 5-like isoform X1 [Penaeus monodon]XP_037788180.1 beta-1,3-galactosyltransferase 5-like isoform X2 [Penaeus monodon]
MRRKQGVLAMVMATVAVIILVMEALPSAPVTADDYENFSYRFVRLYSNVNLTDATVNPIPGLVTWRYDLSHRVICNGTDPFMLNIVPSAIPNFKQRSYIRNTWADKALYPYTRMRTVFVLGKTLNATLQGLVEEEIQTYDDIIQSNFIDSYRNLTYKSMSWLSWVRDWCPEVPFVVKTDDDVLVNPFHLKTYLAKELERNAAPSDIYGRVRARNKPMRKGKWNVTKEEYKLTYYPPFVLGPAYIVSGNAVDRLLQYAAHTPFLWLEDVYITGLVASAAGINRVQAERTLYTKKLNRDLYSRQTAFLLGADEKRKKVAWSSIVRNSPVKYASRRKRRGS